MGFLTAGERAVVAAAAERLVPADPPCPGATAAGAVDYIDGLLDAFAVDPPRIWAGGPYSGRHGGEASFEQWLPLGPMEEQAWRARIGEWQRQYRELLDALGPDFATAGGAEQDRRLAAVAGLRRLLYEHTCEGVYGDPAYGGNRDRATWDAIGWIGDIQPRGYTEVEVSSREKLPISRAGAGG
jgi:hypothetical protein